MATTPISLNRRIMIKTVVPAGTEVADARKAAREEACAQLGIHIVEESLLPSVATYMDPIGQVVDSPNDHTVERVLTTVWDFHQ